MKAPDQISAGWSSSAGVMSGAIALSEGRLVPPLHHGRNRRLIETLTLRETKLRERVLQPAAVRAGLGRLTWHQFRHVHSSLLNDLGVPMEIAEDRKYS